MRNRSPKLTKEEILENVEQKVFDRKFQKLEKKESLTEEQRTLLKLLFHYLLRLEQSPYRLEHRANEQYFYVFCEDEKIGTITYLEDSSHIVTFDLFFPFFEEDDNESIMFKKLKKHSGKGIGISIHMAIFKELSQDNSQRIFTIDDSPTDREIEIWERFEELGLATQESGLSTCSFFQEIPSKTLQDLEKIVQQTNTPSGILRRIANLIKPL